MSYLQLAIAIIFELVGTTLLKKSEGFSHAGFAMASVLCYGVAFYFLSKVMVVIPVGIAYAIWSGVGLFLLTLIGYFVWKEKLDLPAIVGMVLIVSGVVVINVFSKTAGH
ncbi:SMR family transporter [Bdellovibrio sp. HCB288]|uniref:SMR family transporter n=1 Tax=Bdellovibrio sp. HCB288 TaxID=3394355 RepID=UPI0039B373CA